LREELLQHWENELAEILSLDGEWEFALDGRDGTIRVPGTWEAQGYPHRIDGPAVYRKKFHVPAAWSGQCIQLQFDAASYNVEVEINNTQIGSHTGLWTPFAFDLTEMIHPGEDNVICLSIYKPGERFPMRESLAGFLPDVCVTFGGLWQSARFVAFPDAAISDVSISSDLASGEVKVTANLHRAEGLSAVVQIRAPDGNEVAVYRAPADTSLQTNLMVNTVQAWSPDLPALYTAQISLENDAGDVFARTSRKSGFRKLSRDGDQLLLNSEPIFLRGALNWGWYPDILCPAPDEATIRDEFRRVREFGYNMVKLCLYIPSPLYFQIADEEGMLLWLELPMWLPEVTDYLRTQALLEYADILRKVHHHPSIVIYSLGCELGSAVDSDLLSRLNDLLRSRTSGVLACDNSGSGEAYGGLAFDYADFNDYHFYCDLHYFNPLLDHFRRDWRPERPWIFGEFCDADDYRDLGEIAARFGGELPWWLVEQNPIHPLTAIAYSKQLERMAQLDLPFDNQDLQYISRQQSFVVRKTILEKVRAKASMGGYIVTGLRDTPLATSSMFDDLGRAKYDARAFREFNGDAVLALEQGRARVWRHGGDRPAAIDRFNHLANTPVDFRVVLSNVRQEFIQGELRWQLVHTDGQVKLEGNSQIQSPPTSSTPHEIGNIAFTTPAIETAQQYTLAVRVGELQNHWPLWVYPTVTSWPDAIALYDPAGALNYLNDLGAAVQCITSPGEAGDKILIASMYTPEVHAYIHSGGGAIVLQTATGGLPAQPCSFWRESLKLLYLHPIMTAFPHQAYVDLQFYHLATDYGLGTSELTTLPDVKAVKPIFRRLHARHFTLLDYLIELDIGNGKLLASTLRFGGGAGDQVTGLKANIAGQHLLYSMLQYLLKTE
jgi:hypothetical protein